MKRKSRKGMGLSTRLVESLASLYAIQSMGIKMDLRQVLLRYVTSSGVSAHRVIYHLVRYGYIKTPCDDLILKAVDERLAERGIRKGPYVGYTIAGAVESVLGRYDVLDKWHITNEGTRYLKKKLGSINVSIDEIKDKSPLLSVSRIRRAYLQKYIAAQRRGPSILDYYGGQPPGGWAVEIRNEEAAREFVLQALASIAPEKRGVEPKAGFAIAFARDEDAAAHDLIESRLWRDLNLNHVNPLITNYRNYLISYAVSMLHPIGRGKILEFIENSANWPGLARQGRAERAEKYLEDAIRSGYIIDRAGVLYFQDPFIANKEKPRSYIEYLNEIYFEGSIIGTAGLNWKYESNIVKAVSSIAATILWQSAYSHPIPIVRDGSGKILVEEWLKELKSLASGARGRILAFPQVMDGMGTSSAREVLEQYISPFLRKVIEGRVMYTVKAPEGGYEYLIPRGLSMKIFNIFRDEQRDDRVAQLIYSVKVMLESAPRRGPFITRKVFEDVMENVFGDKSEAIISRLLGEGLLIELGDEFVLTPYDLPAVYLDLLKGSTAIPHAQSFSVNILKTLYYVPQRARSDFISLLKDLEDRGRVPLRDYNELVIVAPDAVYFISQWIARLDRSDPENPVLELLREEQVGFDARFAARVLREALGWSPTVVQLSRDEAVKVLREHVEGRDVRELSESIERLGKEGRLYEPPYEERRG
jgi:hypothetical protein